jgi:hypothetical protein
VLFYELCFLFCLLKRLPLNEVSIGSFTILHPFIGTREFQVLLRISGLQAGDLSFYMAIKKIICINYYELFLYEKPFNDFHSMDTSKSAMPLAITHNLVSDDLTFLSSTFAKISHKLLTNGQRTSHKQNAATLSLIYCDMQSISSQKI